MRKLLWRLALVTVIVAASELVVVTASADPVPRTEDVLISPATGVVKSLVRLHSPLPASAGPRPSACDDNVYLRYRSSAGPSTSAAADKVVTLMPGIFGGASMLEPLAVQVVNRAAAAGQHIEVWAHSRRSLCFYDRTGLDDAETARNSQLAVDYYFGDHSKFAGWPSGRELAVLEADGFQQQLTDWREAIIEAVPRQQDRRTKVFCGGHSMGGLTVNALVSWEFGTPEAPQPGYDLCSGLIYLDSRATASGAANTGTPLLGDLIYNLSHGAAKLGLLPTFNNLPVVQNLVADTVTFLRIAALAAYQDPEGESHLLQQLPHTLNTDLFTRVWLSRTYAQAVTNTPDVRSFRYTNAALFGALLDNNASPLAPARVSMGSLVGPVAPREFVLPLSVRSSPGTGAPMPVFDLRPQGGEAVVGALDPTVLYRWRDYQEPADPDVDGRIYSTPDKEFSDLRTVAKVMFEGPADFLDPFFASVQMTDGLFQFGGSAGYFANAKYPDGPQRLPQLFLHALGTAFDVSSADSHPAGSVEAPNYSHLDVLVAAPRQQGGGAPIPVVAVTDFVTKR